MLKIYCDEMLKGLGRWLRAAGYDTRIADGGLADRELLAVALREGRWLLTRDVKLTEHRRARQAVVLLSCNRIDACAREAARQLPIDWLYRPFSRCLLCNTELCPLPAEHRARIPAGARSRLSHVSDARWCSSCDKVYWPGTHTRRMRAILERWQSRGCAEGCSPALGRRSGSGARDARR
jgi:uncharacterized protein with PIN domain